MPPEQVTPIAFWFLRHGETDWNTKDLSQGNVDIPLNQNGLAQARSAALLLRGRGIVTILSSPLSRARVTADIVGETLGLPVAVEENLREVSFGIKEGQPMGDWFAPWVAGHYTPEGAESFDQLTRRSVAVINRCIVRPPLVLVVAHGAVFRALRGAMGHEPNVRTRNAVPVWCEPPKDGAGKWAISYAE